MVNGKSIQMFICLGHGLERAQCSIAKGQAQGTGKKIEIRKD